MQASTTLCIDTEIWHALQILLMSVFTASCYDCVIFSRVSMHFKCDAFSPSTRPEAVTDWWRYDVAQICR